MNPKSLLFDKFLKEEEIISFERKDFDDEDGTVVYRSYIKVSIMGYAFIRHSR